MYGQTEATARISYVPYEKLKEKIGSAGIPIPGGNIKIIENELEVEECFKSGELVYTGDNVMLGYATSSKCLSKGDELKGTLRTGDLAYKDEQDFVFITGRMKRFLKIFGLRLNLDEVEKLVENTFKIQTVCIGSDDALKVLVETNEQKYLNEIKNKIVSVYGIHHTAVSIKMINYISVTSSGKRNYKEMENLYK